MLKDIEELKAKVEQLEKVVARDYRINSQRIALVERKMLGVETDDEKFWRLERERVK